MVIRYFSLCFLMLLGSVLSAVAIAAPSAQAVRMDVIPELDGKVLDDRSNKHGVC